MIEDERFAIGVIFDSVACGDFEVFGFGGGGAVSIVVIPSTGSPFDFWVFCYTGSHSRLIISWFINLQ